MPETLCQALYIFYITSNSSCHIHYPQQSWKWEPTLAPFTAEENEALSRKWLVQGYKTPHGRARLPARQFNTSAGALTTGPCCLSHTRISVAPCPSLQSSGLSPPSGDSGWFFFKFLLLIFSVSSRKFQVPQESLAAPPTEIPQATKAQEYKYGDD